VIQEVVRDCQGKGLICDEWVEFDDSVPPILCGEPAVLQIDFMGEGGSTSPTFCVRHALELVARINQIIVESTEEG
jgi:hypothetical protein